MNKTLTDELIVQKLAEQGWLDINEVDEEHKKKMVLGYYEVEFTDRFNNGCQYYIYNESTRDGYEVWVATEDMGNVCISEDVYYYDSDLCDPLYDAIFDYNELIYVDDLEAYYVQDAIERVWETFITEMIDEVENELIEQGYEHENKAEVA